jgi:hypothetical protein
MHAMRIRGGMGEEVGKVRERKGDESDVKEGRRNREIEREGLFL